MDPKECIKPCGGLALDNGLADPSFLLPLDRSGPAVSCQILPSVKSDPSRVFTASTESRCYWNTATKSSSGRWESSRPCVPKESLALWLSKCTEGGWTSCSHLQEGRLGWWQKWREAIRSFPFAFLILLPFPSYVYAPFPSCVSRSAWSYPVSTGSSWSPSGQCGLSRLYCCPGGMCGGCLS